jgi:hypothetical protein
MKLGVIQKKEHKVNLASLLNRFDLINRIEVIPENADLTKDPQFSWNIEYKNTKEKALVRFEIDSEEVLVIPLDKLSKIEISQGKTTIRGKNLDFR